MADEYAYATEILKAVANPLRLRILQLLAGGPLCVHDLVAATGSSQPLVSQHLRVLRGARLISGERRRQEMLYSLQDSHVGEIVLQAINHARERTNS
jgi:DNA-binding transcriptional ArsR family regulator